MPARRRRNEQFYLLWPACLLLAGIARSKKVAALLILAVPAIRVVCHLLWPSVGMERELLMFHDRVDTLMTGCAAAMFYEKLQFRWRWAPAVGLFLFVVSLYLDVGFEGRYVLSPDLNR